MGLPRMPSGNESTCWAEDMQEAQVQSLGREDPLEKKKNGNPLQYSCLGNPMDREAWWATVHGVAEEVGMI